MGLGKTLTVLSYLKLVKDQREETLIAKSIKNDEEFDEEKTTCKEEDEENASQENFHPNSYLKKLKNIANNKKCAKRLRTLIILPASLL
jgi:hypothetical protein